MRNGHRNTTTAPAGRPAGCIAIPKRKMKS